MRGGLRNGLLEKYLNNLRGKVAHLKGFVADDIGDWSCHKGHLVREMFRIPVDKD